MTTGLKGTLTTQFYPITCSEKKVCFVCLGLKSVIKEDIDW